jgi:N-acetylneuraminate synthase
VSANQILPGERISHEDLTAKSPGTGISPQRLSDIIGLKVQKTVNEDSLISWDMFGDLDSDRYKIDLENWGIVVRFSDVNASYWGAPDIYEFRINDQDLGQDFSLKQQDVRMSAHAPDKMGHSHLDLSSLDERKRTRSVNKIQKCIDLVRNELKPNFMTESPYIIVHPGGVTKHQTNSEIVPQLNNNFEKSLNELDTDGVILLAENMPPISWLFGGEEFCNNFRDAHEIADFCRRTGVRLCYDTSHAMLYCNYANQDFYEHAKKLKPYVDYLHISDARGIGGEGLQVGDGEINFDRFFRLYKHFNGPIITEIWRGHEQRGMGFKKAAEQLTEITTGW